MPERQEGINPQRADELERLLERQFEIAGLGKPDFYKGQSAIEIIDSNLGRHPTKTFSDVLDQYLQARAVEPGLRVQIALICGELFGTGDLSDIRSRLERIEAIRNSGAAVVS